MTEEIHQAHAMGDSAVTGKTEGDPAPHTAPPEELEYVPNRLGPACATPREPVSMMRHFDSGASRNLDDGKLQYVRALSPRVLQSYVQYMARHNSDVRDESNWKLGFPYDVLLDSLFRHQMDVWLNHVKLGHLARADLEEALNGVLFNAMAYLHQLLQEDDHV